jgi:hypothetical protein
MNPAPVQVAMALQRPDKWAVRSKWLERVKYFADRYPDDPVPLYVTLPGAEALDVQMLVDSGVIRLTEIGSIYDEDLRKIVAVESDASAAIEVRKKFPGLRLLKDRIDNLLHGKSLIRYPNGDLERILCGRVINLDLNEILAATDEDPAAFPVLLMIQKLCELHAVSKLEWALCLTLHAELRCATETLRSMLKLLAENVNEDSVFANELKEFLGGKLFDSVAAVDPLFAQELAPSDQQRFLMVIVPKFLARMLFGSGWVVSITSNLRYGGSAGRAPMVSWVFEFAWDSASRDAPQTTYVAHIRGILSAAGNIAEDGTIQAV